MSDFHSKDFGIFYSDFVTPASIAGVIHQVLFTKEELELDDGFGHYPTFRSNFKFSEGDEVIVNPDSIEPDRYVIISIKPLEYNEWLHILQSNDD